MIVSLTNHETGFFVTVNSQSIHKNCVMTSKIKFLEILGYGEVISTKNFTGRRHSLNTMSCF